VLILTVHLNLVKHFALGFEPVAWSDVLERVENLLSAGVLLVAKLVCGKTQDHQLVRVLLAELVNLREVPDRCASEGGGVLDEDHLPLVLRHRDHVSIELPGPNAVEIGHPCC